jgi:hypothetical protein
VTYSAGRSNLTGWNTFWQQGGAVELSAEVYHGIGTAANIAGGRASNIDGSGVNLTTVTTTFGPRYTWSPKYRGLAFFGQELIGEAHGLDSVFPSVTGATTNFDSFALQIGGGVDLRLWHRFCCPPHPGRSAAHPVPKRNYERAKQSSPWSENRLQVSTIDQPAFPYLRFQVWGITRCSLRVLLQFF